MIILMIIAMTGFIVTTGPGEYVDVKKQDKVYEAGSRK